MGALPEREPEPLEPLAGELLGAGGVTRLGTARGAGATLLLPSRALMAARGCVGATDRDGLSTLGGGITKSRRYQGTGAAELPLWGPLLSPPPGTGDRFAG